MFLSGWGLCRLLHRFGGSLRADAGCVVACSSVRVRGSDCTHAVHTGLAVVVAVCVVVVAVRKGVSSCAVCVVVVGVLFVGCYLA